MSSLVHIMSICKPANSPRAVVDRFHRSERFRHQVHAAGVTRQGHDVGAGPARFRRPDGGDHVQAGRRTTQQPSSAASRRGHGHHRLFVDRPDLRAPGAVQERWLEADTDALRPERRGDPAGGGGGQVPGGEKVPAGPFDDAGS